MGAPLWVEEPEVEEVLDLETGRYLRHDHAIGHDFDRVMALRDRLRTGIARGAPVYACALCGVAVYLIRQRSRQRFHFRHDIEDGRCPARTRGELTQAEIDARKYNGAKESLAHRRMKEWVAESLRADPAFLDVEVEPRWQGALTGDWRKPDVRAVYDGNPVVFEIQLSTTHLNVIVERREFYRKEGGLLLWVFEGFAEGSRPLTLDDVFYYNNKNALVVSERTRNLSLDRGAFHLECIWAETTAARSGRLRRRFVRFSDLTLDRERQRAYFFDFEAVELARLAEIRDRFEAWWTDRPSREDARTAWDGLRRDLRAAGVRVPDYIAELPHTLLDALYSAKLGRPIGWRFKRFIEVAHRIADGHPKYLRDFRDALLAYGRAEQIKGEDKSGRFRKKADEYKRLLHAGDAKYISDRPHEDLLCALFPEVFARR